MNSHSDPHYPPGTDAPTTAATADASDQAAFVSDGPAVPPAVDPIPSQPAPVERDDAGTGAEKPAERAKTTRRRKAPTKAERTASGDLNSALEALDAIKGKGEQK